MIFDIFSDIFKILLKYRIIRIKVSEIYVYEHNTVFQKNLFLLQLIMDNRRKIKKNY